MLLLPEPLAAKVARLIEEGEAFADDEALALFQSAWALLPEPKGQWDVSLQLLVAIADSHFHLGEFETCHRDMQRTLRDCGGEPDNPFIRLRIGECLLELGSVDEAKNWLVGVYLMEGIMPFQGEDPKYLPFARAGLEPPPGGWPEGW
jgi:hypothetical protein